MARPVGKPKGILENPKNRIQDGEAPTNDPSGHHCHVLYEFRDPKNRLRSSVPPKPPYPHLGKWNNDQDQDAPSHLLGKQVCAAISEKEMDRSMWSFLCPGPVLTPVPTRSHHHNCCRCQARFPPRPAWSGANSVYFSFPEERLSPSTWRCERPGATRRLATQPAPSARCPAAAAR